VSELLVVNALITPDGTRLQSYSCYDFKEYVDANGKTYMVDGGIVYRRRSANGDEVDDSLFLHKDDFEVIRDAVTWGTYGKDGDQPLQRVAVSEMSYDHIQALLGLQNTIHPNLREVLLMEHQYRIENLIEIRD
jgi:hypothetical protein